MRRRFREDDVIVFNNTKYIVASVTDIVYYLGEYDGRGGYGFMALSYPIHQIDRIARLDPEYKALRDFDNELQELINE